MWGSDTGFLTVSRYSNGQIVEIFRRTGIENNTFERVRSKRAFLCFIPSCEDQKGLSDNNKLLIPLTCEILLKYF